MMVTERQSAAMPQYEEHLTVFVDFLGFTPTVKKEDSAANILALLKSISERQTDYEVQTFPVPGMSPAAARGIVQTIQPAMSAFSDHIVISYPLAQIEADWMVLDKSTVVAHAAYYIAAIAEWALRLGLLVRGGATIGKLYHADRIVFGEALVEAYEIESKTSVYPRVVVSQRLLRHWPNAPLLSTDADGLSHLDYLQYLPQQWSSPLAASLERIVGLVEENLLKLRQEGKLRELAKWIWFRQKFLQILDHLPANIEISSDALASARRRLAPA